MSVLARNTRTNGVLLFLGHVCVSAGFFFTNLLLVRVLPKEDYAVFVLVLSVTFFLTTVGNLGLPTASAKLIAKFLGAGKIKDVPNVIQGTMYLGFLSGLAGALLLWFFSDVVAGFFFQPALGLFLKVTSFWVFSYIIMMSMAGIFNGFGRMEYSAWVSVGNEFLKFFFLVFAVIAGGTLCEFLYAQSVAIGLALLGALVLFSSLVREKGLTLNGVSVQDGPGFVLREAFYLYPGFVIPKIISLVMYLSLGRLASSVDVANFGVSLPITSITVFILIPFLDALLPAVSAQSVQDSSRLQAMGTKLLRGTAAFSFFVLGLFVFLGSWIIPLIYGAQYQNVAPLVVLLSFGMFFEGLSLVADTFLRGTRHQKKSAGVEAGRFFFLVLVAVPMIYMKGATGAAWAIGMASCGAALIRLTLIHRLLKIECGKLLSSFLLPMGLLVVVAVISGGFVSLFKAFAGIFLFSIFLMGWYGRDLLLLLPQGISGNFGERIAKTMQNIHQRVPGWVPKILPWRIRYGIRDVQWGCYRKKNAIFNTFVRRLTSPVLVTSIPKSGTHLVRALLMMLPGAVSRKDPIIPFEIETRAGQIDFCKQQLQSVEAGEICVGHFPYDAGLSAWLEDRGIKRVFIYRDPRDYIVSFYHYIMNYTPRFFTYEMFRDLETDQDRIMACIRGIGEGRHSAKMTRNSFPNVFDSYRQHLGWRGDAKTFSLRFEDLVGDNYQESGPVLEGLMQYLKVLQKPLSVSAVCELVQSARDSKKSPTFRLGQIGRWRNEFRPEHVQAFQEIAGELLLELGYEQDHQWVSKEQGIFS